MLIAELREALEQQPGGKDDFDRKTDLGLPARGQFLGGALQLNRLVNQRLAASIEHLSRGRLHSLSALDLEYLRADQPLQLLDCVAERRLTLVQTFRRLRITAGLDDADQSSPLVQ